MRRRSIAPTARRASVVSMYPTSPPGPWKSSAARGWPRMPVQALLLSPGLCGLDTMRALADDDSLSLPILSHPAFQGSFVVRPGEGISHGLLFGQIRGLRCRCHDFSQLRRPIFLYSRGMPRDCGGHGSADGSAQADFSRSGRRTEPIASRNWSRSTAVTRSFWSVGGCSSTAPI